MVAGGGGIIVSFRVFIVCEDHTLDQYSCVPVIAAALAHVGKPRAVVKVVTSPHLRGISQVETQFLAIAQRYAAISDLVLFVLDRDGLDGADGRGDRFAALQRRRDELPADVSAKVDVILAVEETEVWCLWGQRGGLGNSWNEVRAERDPKEKYFDPLVTRIDLRLPGKGRQRMVKQSLENGWDSLATGCPELRDLEVRLRAFLDAA